MNGAIFRHLALTFVLLTVLGLSFVTDDADGLGIHDTLEDSDIEYVVISEHAVSVKSYMGTDLDVVVPRTIQGGYAVIGVSDRAFAGNGLVSVVLPDSVTSIGEYAFQDCTRLERVSMGDKVDLLKRGAFKGCTSLIEVHLGRSLTTLTTELFSGCTAIERVDVPEFVTSIQKDAFMGCVSLRSINLVNSSFTEGGFLGSTPFTMGTDICSVNCGSTGLDLAKVNAHTDAETTVAFNEDVFTLTITDVLYDPLVPDPVLRTPVVKHLNSGADTDIDDPPSWTGWVFKGWSMSVPTRMPASDVNLVALWDVDVYKVIFNYDVVGSDTYSMTVPFNSTRHLEPNRFVNDSGVFCGWSTVPGGGVVYEDGALFTMSSTSDVNLYAVWDADYFLTFDPNGGTGSMIPQPFIEDHARIISECTFEYTGNKFVGWAEIPDGPVAYVPGDTILLDSDRMIYAKWVEIHYDIVFHHEDGTSDTDLVPDKAYSEEFRIPDLELTYPGHYLIGWSSKMPGSPVYHTGECVSRLPYNGLSGEYVADLYAVWGKHILTVTFHNSVDENVTSQIFSYGTNLPNLRTGVFEYKFHTFDGWATVSDGQVVYRDGADMTDRILDAISSDLTMDLYAVWSVSSYRVVYDPGNGDGHMDFPLVRNFTEYVIEDCAYVCEGYHFKEWRILYSDGSYQSYHPGDVVTNLSDGRDHIVLNAVWEKDDAGLPAWVLYSGASATILVAILGLAFIIRRRV
ncbi:MAG: InlB B-repeat-containing protein [archaeon]|nr:InlB B-repeat-containing protein [archaeon]